MPLTYLSNLGVRISVSQHGGVRYVCIDGKRRIPFDTFESLPVVLERVLSNLLVGGTDVQSIASDVGIEVA